MTLNLRPPKREDQIINENRQQELRLHRFFTDIADNLETLTENSNADLTLTFTTNTPTATTAMTIADGSSPTSAEIGEFMQNITTRFNALQAALQAAGILN